MEYLAAQARHFTEELVATNNTSKKGMKLKFTFDKVMICHVVSTAPKWTKKTSFWWSIYYKFMCCFQTAAWNEVKYKKIDLYFIRFIFQFVAKEQLLSKIKLFLLHNSSAESIDNRSDAA